jgi:hypothetical protein
MHAFIATPVVTSGPVISGTAAVSSWVVVIRCIRMPIIDVGEALR